MVDAFKDLILIIQCGVAGIHFMYELKAEWYDHNQNKTINKNEFELGEFVSLQNNWMIICVDRKFILISENWVYMALHKTFLSNKRIIQLIFNLLFQCDLTS